MRNKFKSSSRKFARGSRARNQRASRRSRYTRNRTTMRYKKKMFTSTLRGRNPFALNKMSTVLKYSTNISLDPKPEALGSTGSNVWQFSINGMFDPDITSFGHQPMYFDNYAAIFGKYQVKYATISVTVINHFVNTIAQEVAGPLTQKPNYAYKLFIMRDATAGSTTEYPNNMEQIIEAGSPNIKWRFIAPALTGKLPKLKHSASPHMLARKSFRDDTLQAATSSNPASGQYFYVGITSADGVTDPPAVSLQVTITYYADFFDRIELQPQN